MTSEKTSHWDAKCYSQNSEMQYNIGMEMINAYPFQGNENILDIGCGDGRTTLQIALRVPQGHVLGVDYSQNMIAFAKDQYKQYQNLQFEIKDAQAINDDKIYDLITSLCCLQWVPNKLLAFQNIKQALKPNGKLLCVMPKTHESLADIRNSLAGEKIWKQFFINNPDPMAYTKDSDYENYAKKAGLNILQYHIEPTANYYSNIEKLTAFLTAITAHIALLPTAADKTKFMEMTVERYIKLHPAEPDGRYKLLFHFVKLLARRAD